jgi:hypothetical protein
MKSQNSGNSILGRLVSADSLGYSFRCMNTQIPLAQLGAMVRACVQPDCWTYALICNISWPEDDVTGQIAEEAEIRPDVIFDNRYSRNNGPTIITRFVGFEDSRINHILPPQPPFVLTEIHIATEDEINRFCGPRPGYIRLLHQARNDLPLVDVLVTHLRDAYFATKRAGNEEWIENLIGELIEQFGEDYALFRDVVAGISRQLPPEI